MEKTFENFEVIAENAGHQHFLFSDYVLYHIKYKNSEFEPFLAVLFWNKKYCHGPGVVGVGIGMTNLNFRHISVITEYISLEKNMSVITDDIYREKIGIYIYYQKSNLRHQGR